LQGGGRDRKDTRRRLLAAAEELSCESGPGRISLEAVAARAGVSKGGLLYHFPTKHELLRALVAEHVEEIRQAMDGVAPGARASGDPLKIARAYLDVTHRELSEACPPPAGVFAAIAEDPEFIAPLRVFRAELLGAFRQCPNPVRATIVFLACQGLVHERLTDPGATDPASLDSLFAELHRMLEGI
jgi:AcrR family transcriptional regulator